LDIRCKWSNPDTGADEKHRLIVQVILAGTSERPVNHHTRENAVKGGIGVSSDHLAACRCIASLFALGIRIASNSLCKRSSEISDDTDMNGDVVFLWGTSESEWMPLKVGNFWAADEDVLTSPSGCLLLLDLEFDNFGWVLDNLGDESPMARTNFAKNAFEDPDDATDQPVTLIYIKNNNDHW
jgi:hypothetical protein